MGSRPGSRAIGGEVRENNADCFLHRMARLLIFIHNGGIWKGTIQPKQKNGTHFSCYESLPKGYNVQISNCLTLTWDAASRNGQRQAWWPKCAAIPSPMKIGSSVKIAFWRFLLQTVFFVLLLAMLFGKKLIKESPYIFSKFKPLNTDTRWCGNEHLFLCQSTNYSHRKPTSLMRTLLYQLCAVIDLSFLKVKNPSFDSMSMFPALPYTADMTICRRQFLASNELCRERFWLSNI